MADEPEKLDYHVPEPDAWAQVDRNLVLPISLAVIMFMLLGALSVWLGMH